MVTRVQNQFSSQLDEFSEALRKEGYTEPTIRHLQATIIAEDGWPALQSDGPAILRDIIELIAGDMSETETNIIFRNYRQLHRLPNAAAKVAQLHQSQAGTRAFIIMSALRMLAVSINRHEIEVIAALPEERLSDLPQMVAELAIRPEP